MLDRLMSGRNVEKDVFTDAYTPDQAIVSSKLVNPTGRNLAVLFPPWHGGGRHYEQLIARLARRDSAVLAYYFHDEILKPDALQVQKSFDFLRDRIADQLAVTTGEADYNRVRLIAMSLGNPVMSMVTTRFADFDQATFVVNSSSLARSAWNGIRTTHVRAGIEAQGFNLPELEELWREMTPVNHLDELAGKQVDIIMSSTDEIIPARFQREFTDGVRDAGINPNVQETRLGHYAAIGKFCWIGSSV